MKLRIFTAFVLGGLAYIIVILRGLLSFQPLSYVYRQGMIAFGIIFICGFLLIFLLQILNDIIDKSKKKAEVDRKTAEQESEESKDDFSPMDPPVIEYKNSEERGNK